MNLILFLLLALTASRTGLVQCEEEKEEEDIVNVVTSQPGVEDPENNGDAAGSGDGSNQGSTPNSGSVDNEESGPTIGTDTDAVKDDLTLVIMIIIPLVLTLVIVAVIVCVVMIYRRGRIKVAGTKEDPYLDHEDHEKVPMPMFEDDIPSVMELEMEDLENWISKDGGKKVDIGQI
ncbi:transmembrane protein 154 isoform X2 [Megalobrama amblycephala]|uniref:transmembrane protein 154 isoform X2 n=1 Tax=Megalobrama amblycephala TaxID=75352 RepID=UPI0020145C6A|nr:transmembrane protein 154 isoform X2 [Megalobrama amblycephala]